MTDIEMRKRLAEAMGWTSVHMDYGNLVGTRPDHHGSRCWYAPNPLENDYDAAMLRAWCAEQGWRITCCHDEGAAWWRVSDLRCQGPRAECMVKAAEEPDYCRRERVALCRAVLQVIETGGAA